jgi:hypothetical protein
MDYLDSDAALDYRVLVSSSFIDTRFVYYHHEDSSVSADKTKAEKAEKRKTFSQLQEMFMIASILHPDIARAQDEFRKGQTQH